MTTVDQPVASPRSVRSRIYTDPAIAADETRRIFGTTWNFLAHESELRQPGDFVVRYIADDSVIVVRGDDGELRAFYNVCQHRGMQLCRGELGRTTRFTCGYHGWRYDRTGRLVGVPLERPYFGENGLDREQHSLRPIAQLDSAHGFVFGTFSETAGPLDQYLGAFDWYLAIHALRDPAGLEVIGEPQRWVVRGNWKSGAENAMGDSYHAQYTHRSVMEIGIHPNAVSDWQGRGTRNGVHVDAGPATMAFARQTPQERGYPDALVALFQQHMPAEQRELIFDNGPLWPTRTAVFPNLMMLNAGAYLADDQLVPFLFCRVWRPLGADATEVWNWVLVERSSSDEFKRDSQRAYILTFGPSGTEEQDDAENFGGIARALRGERSSDLDQPLTMGLDHETGRDLADEMRLPEWPGPGTAIGTTYTDAGNRRFAQLWNDAMNETGNEPPGPSPVTASGEERTDVRLR